VPQQGRPIIRSGLKSILVEQSVVTRCQRVVHDDFHAATRQAGMFN